MCDHEMINLDMTALLYAVRADHSSCVERLLLAGANQDGIVSSSYRLSPAVLAVTSLSITSLRILLQAGCRLDLCGRSNPQDEDTNLLDLIANGRNPAAESDYDFRNMLSAVHLNLQVRRLCCQRKLTQTHWRFIKSCYICVSRVHYL
jgi:ankyrin repeat protein